MSKINQLNQLLNNLEHAITHQSGARKSFGELKAFLLDEDVEVADVIAPEDLKAGGAQGAPLGAPDGADTEPTSPD